MTYKHDKSVKVKFKEQTKETDELNPNTHLKNNVLIAIAECRPKGVGCVSWVCPGQNNRSLTRLQLLWNGIPLRIGSYLKRKMKVSDRIEVNK